MYTKFRSLTISEAGPSSPILTSPERSEAAEPRGSLGEDVVDGSNITTVPSQYAQYRAAMGLPPEVTCGPPALESLGLSCEETRVMYKMLLKYYDDKDLKIRDFRGASKRIRLTSKNIYECGNEIQEALGKVKPHWTVDMTPITGHGGVPGATFRLHYRPEEVTKVEPGPPASLN